MANTEVPGIGQHQPPEACTPIVIRPGRRPRSRRCRGLLVALRGEPADVAGHPAEHRWRRDLPAAAVVTRRRPGGIGQVHAVQMSRSIPATATTRHPHHRALRAALVAETVSVTCCAGCRRPGLPTTKHHDPAGGPDLAVGLGVADELVRGTAWRQPPTKRERVRLTAVGGAGRLVGGVVQRGPGGRAAVGGAHGTESPPAGAGAVVADRDAVGGPLALVVVQFVGPVEHRPPGGGGRRDGRFRCQRRAGGKMSRCKQNRTHQVAATAMSIAHAEPTAHRVRPRAWRSIATSNAAQAALGAGGCSCGGWACRCSASATSSNRSLTAAANARHRSNLSSGCFARALQNTSSRCASSGRQSLSRGGSSCRCWLITAIGFDAKAAYRGGRWKAVAAKADP